MVPVVPVVRKAGKRCASSDYISKSNSTRSGRQNQILSVIQGTGKSNQVVRCRYRGIGSQKNGAVKEDGAIGIKATG